jgi:hypothetical protein
MKGIRFGPRDAWNADFWYRFMMAGNAYRGRETEVIELGFRVVWGGWHECT